MSYRILRAHPGRIRFQARSEQLSGFPAALRALWNPASSLTADHQFSGRKELFRSASGCVGESAASQQQVAGPAPAINGALGNKKARRALRRDSIVVVAAVI